MEFIDSTYKILALKSLHRSVDEKWAEWAIDMLTTGFDSEHLRILAGIEKPYNQFYLQDLTDKVFKELNLDYSKQEEVIRNYTYYLVSEVLNGKNHLFIVLRLLKDMYEEIDYQKEYQDFYLLYWAKDDLENSNVQWYWPDADRNNIDKVILDYFKHWKARYEAENYKII
ncbi:MAG TPA: hypothetical protein VF487_11060 [Chitinophagaceae bacterium]